MARRIRQWCPTCDSELTDAYRMPDTFNTFVCRVCDGWVHAVKTDPTPPPTPRKPRAARTLRVNISGFEDVGELKAE